MIIIISQALTNFEKCCGLGFGKVVRIVFKHRNIVRSNSARINTAKLVHFKRQKIISDQFEVRVFKSFDFFDFKIVRIH